MKQNNNNQQPQHPLTPEQELEISEQLATQTQGANLPASTEKALKNFAGELVMQTISDIQTEKLKISGNSIFDVLKVFKHIAKIAGKKEKELIAKLNSQNQLTDGRNDNTQS